MSELNSVQRFYKDKTILITGASGFMGKMLLEKFLYSCSDVKELIVIMRAKRGQPASKRIEGYPKLPLFKRVVDEKPEMFKKITVLSGEISESHLGLNNDDYAYVIENTQIIFHLAASVKLEATLKPNILMNLTGTKNVLDIAKEMKNLIIMVHTSTAFCNVDHKIVEEKVYEFPHRPEDLMRCAEWMSEEAMAKVQKEVLLFHPNTYTYTKRLAEILVQDEYHKSNIPVCIVRPSIVLPSFWEPLFGWVDSLNGPPGIGVAVGKGALRTILVNPNANFEAVPVDMATNGLIMMAKKLGTTKERPKEIQVCNITAHESSKVPYGYMYGEGEKIRFKAPFAQMLWYPNCKMTQSKIYYAINAFLFQWIPAYFIDFWMWVFRQPRFMVKVQKKISDGMDVLQFFTINDWNFKSDNYFSLVEIQDREEWEMFLVDGRNVGNNDKYMWDCAMGIRQYCARDPLTTVPRARITMYILFIFDTLFKLLFFYWVGKKLLMYGGLWNPIVEFLNESQQRFSSRNLL